MAHVPILLLPTVCLIAFCALIGGAAAASDAQGGKAIGRDDAVISWWFYPLDFPSEFRQLPQVGDFTDTAARVRDAKTEARDVDEPKSDSGRTSHISVGLISQPVQLLDELTLSSVVKRRPSSKIYAASPVDVLAKAVNLLREEEQGEKSRAKIIILISDLDWSHLLRDSLNDLCAMFTANSIRLAVITTQDLKQPYIALGIPPSHVLTYSPAAGVTEETLMTAINACVSSAVLAEHLRERLLQPAIKGDSVATLYERFNQLNRLEGSEPAVRSAGPVPESRTERVARIGLGTRPPSTAATKRVNPRAANFRDFSTKDGAADGREYEGVAIIAAGAAAFIAVIGAAGAIIWKRMRTEEVFFESSDSSACSSEESASLPDVCVDGRSIGHSNCSPDDFFTPI